ncbi:MAG: hypothetical protein RLZZ436_711 [Planctomycetota bacterium]|jgi:hypothetical protein
MGDAQTDSGGTPGNNGRLAREIEQNVISGENFDWEK